MPEIETDIGFTFDYYIGVDGIPVVHVDTGAGGLIKDDDKGPICRVYVNDGLVHGEELDKEDE